MTEFIIYLLIFIIFLITCLFLHVSKKYRNLRIQTSTDYILPTIIEKRKIIMVQTVFEIEDDYDISKINYLISKRILDELKQSELLTIKIIKERNEKRIVKGIIYCVHPINI